MKTKKLLFSAILVLALGFVSCKTETETKDYLITFEDVTLGNDGYWDGSDKSGKFTSEGFEFQNSYTIWPSGMTSWNGFACSSKTDTETQGFLNQFSVIAGKGANNTKQFAVIFDNDATFTCPKNENGYYTIQSLMITNSTYAYLYMKEGDGYNEPFETDDFFKVIIKGFKGTTETGTIEYYLADFREGKQFISKEWATVNLSSLGEVDKVTFSFDSTDKSEYEGVVYLNNPAYACVDNILLTQEIEK
ncbi:DUF4465 domain-containing protein [Paludibacter sp. 221]|uniref:DUF4465 domain-containing protein n=1 Tax=Paludibacter sp. 221 TaxID=2302939 RepID=UPI0013D29762|nr:DUF4465 domain-containing protein [Paludibacter sp. 221]